MDCVCVQVGYELETYGLRVRTGVIRVGNLWIARAYRWDTS